ncbi:MAG: AAA family ATPase [Actinomycetota bacterium]|nr:AAA family ATPase [Actinomycetota bacterium]
MHLFRAELLSFRGHKEASFEPIPGINVIIGDNGCGKSNPLEGIFVLMRGRSFGTSQDDALIQLGERASVIRGRFKGEKRDSKIEMGINADAGKEIRLNGLRLEKLKDLKSSFGIVTLSPEDLKLVKGGPEEKRALMDEAGGPLAQNMTMRG